MTDPTDAELDAALAAGEHARLTEPRARAARYDAANDRIVVELTSGATFAFPPEIAQGLRGADAAALAEVRVSPSGYGLHWAALDADLAVPRLLEGNFGTAKWMREMDLLRHAAE